MTARAIIEAVAEKHGLKYSDLVSRRREHFAFLVAARQEAMALIRRELKMSYSRIGYIMGGYHHTTVMARVRKFGDQPIEIVPRKSNREICGEIDLLRERVRRLESDLSRLAGGKEKA